MGVERTTAILEGVNDNYTSSIWKDVIEKIEEIYASSDSYESKVVKEAIKIFTEILTVLLNGIATMINIKYRKIPQAIIWLVEFQAIVLRAFMQLKIVKH